jgi:periplasmic divalent cation tolerance protein
MIIILTTTQKKQDAEKLAKRLIEKKLAACINIVKIEKSIYRWKGKIVNDKEFLLVIKSTKERYEKVEHFLRANHPNELPEIIAIPVECAYKKYLNWITKN